MFSVSCPFNSPSRLLSPPGEPSVCTHQRRRRHIVFITRLLPAGPGLALIGWLTWMSQLNMQHFPILFTFPSGNHIRHGPKNSSRHLCAHYTLTAVQAGTHMHRQAKKEEGVRFFFKMLELLFLFLLSCCTVLHPFHTATNY